MIKYLHLYFTLLLLAVCGSSWAQSLTITFGKSASPTAISSSTKASTVVTSGTEYLLTQPFSNVQNAHYGHLSTAIRLGISGSGGTLSLALADAYHVYATSITVKAQLCDATKSASLSVNGLTDKKVASSESDISFTLDGHEITQIDL